MEASPSPTSSSICLIKTERKATSLSIQMLADLYARYAGRYGKRNLPTTITPPSLEVKEIVDFSGALESASILTVLYCCFEFKYY